jgi:Flp pilus assembly protein TadG
MLKLRTKRKTQHGNRRGALAVEMAFTIPIVLLIMFASVELTRYIMIRHTVQNAAYEASRAAMVPGGDHNSAIAKATKLCESIGIKNPGITVTPSVVDDTISEVRVDIVVGVDENFWMLNLLSADAEIKGQSSLNREQLDSIFW